MPPAGQDDAHEDPEVPEAAETVETPEVPEVPEAAETAGTAGTVETPEAAEVPEAAETAGTAGTVETPEAAETAASGRGRRRVWPAVLGLVTVGLGAFGIWAAVTAHGLRATAASANTALVDRAATGAVETDITGAVNTIFSYSYADTARTRTAAQELLTGSAIRQYNQLFALVQRQAPKEKLVVTTRVTNVGVELLTGGRARLLVFANQQDTRAGTGQTSYGGAMFAVTAVTEHGSWKIESIGTFTGPA